MSKTTYILKYHLSYFISRKWRQKFFWGLDTLFSKVTNKSNRLSMFNVGQNMMQNTMSCCSTNLSNSFQGSCYQQFVPNCLADNTKTVWILISKNQFCNNLNCEETAIFIWKNLLIQQIFYKVTVKVNWSKVVQMDA